MAGTTIDQHQQEGQLTAKRGMVLVHAQTCRDFVIGQPLREYERYDIGVVTSVTRDGLVRRYRTAWGSEKPGPAEPKRFRGRVLLVPGADAEAAIAVATAHHWPGHPGQPKPYDSLAEVRDALRPLVEQAA